MGEAVPLVVRALVPADRAWAERLLIAAWGSPVVISRGRSHDAAALPGLVAWRGPARLGLLTYHIAGDACEIVTLNSVTERAGAGSALIAAVLAVARAAACRRVWLITTNDNLPALGFYQRRGFHLVAVYPDALTESRRLKPSIPLAGRDGIPLRDELELEIVL